MSTLPRFIRLYASSVVKNWGFFRRSLNLYSVYGLFIQDEFVKGISYGMKTYETHGPSIIAVAPGQIGGVEDNGELITRKGWVLLWSPELTQGTAPRGKAS